MHGYAGYFAYRERARDDHVFALLVHGQRLTGHFGRNTAHHVVTGWDNRNWLFHRVDVREGAGQLQNARQTGFQHFFTQMVEFQLRVWTPRAVTAAAFTNFDHDGTRHHVTARQVFRVWRITLHEALAMFVQQVATFTTAAFCHQYARPSDTGWVELPHLHVTDRHARADSHTDTITGVDVGVGGGLVNTACTAGRQHRSAGFEVDHFTSFDAQGGTTHHGAIGVFHQIQRIPLGEDGGVVFRFC